MDNQLVSIPVFATPPISGLSVLFLRISRPNLKLILSFSGAYLFGISVLHLLPEVYQSPSGGYSIGLLISGLSVLFLRISRPNLKLILSFSGAYLFGISVLHLLPEVYQSPSGGYSIGLF